MLSEKPVKKVYKKRGGVRKKAEGKQKKPRRLKDKYPYLNPENSLKTRAEETADVASYVGQLNEEEKAWMNQFMKEYVNAHTEDAVFHKTSQEKKICNDKNNARNRCQYTREVAQGTLNLAGSDADLEALIYGNMDNNETEEEYEEVGDDSEIET